MMVIHVTSQDFGDFDWELPREFTNHFQRRTKEQQVIHREYMARVIQLELTMLLYVMSHEGADLTRAINHFSQSKEHLAQIFFPKKE